MLEPSTRKFCRTPRTVANRTATRRRVWTSSTANFRGVIGCRVARDSSNIGALEYKRRKTDFSGISPVEARLSPTCTPRLADEPAHERARTAAHAPTDGTAHALFRT